MTRKSKDRLLIVFYTLVFSVAMAIVVECFGQELKGPAILEPGTITVFEIIPPQEAAWSITPTKNAIASHYVDTSSAKLYFATPKSGSFSIVAAIVVDGKPKQLVATLVNGNGEDDDNGPSPTPKPDIETEIGKWIKAQVPVLVKSDNLDAEKIAIKAAIDSTVEKIERGEVTTAAMARTKLQVALTENLADAGDNSVKIWMEFLTEFSKAQDTFLGEKINDLAALKMFFSDAAKAFITEPVEPEKKKEKIKSPIIGEQKPEEVKAEIPKPEPVQQVVKKYQQVCTPRGCYYMEVNE